jgi:hypothetical protein
MDVAASVGCGDSATPRLLGIVVVIIESRYSGDAAQDSNIVVRRTETTQRIEMLLRPVFVEKAVKMDFGRFKLTTKHMGRS